jgi:D-glycero-alpha-D-manno-heptose 1-phosphate guanylyltransferase
MKLKALILAGGFGTRLQSVVSDVPKSLAAINGKPFLFYLLDHLGKQGIEEVILSVGYKADLVIDTIGSRHGNMTVNYCKETTPLGTGGAIRFALSQYPDFENMLVLNGDTFAAFDIKGFYDFHRAKGGGISIVAKRMINFDRYGSLTIDSNDRVVSFNEKKFTSEGFISCGAYIISKQFFEDVFMTQPKTSFSIETDVLQKGDRKYDIQAFASDFYFIDIGIPEDYAQAQVDFARFK